MSHQAVTFRPLASLVAGELEVELLAASVPGTGRDVVLVRGVEPQLRWRTFCAAIAEVALTVRAELAKREIPSLPRIKELLAIPDWEGQAKWVAANSDS